MKPLLFIFLFLQSFYSSSQEEKTTQGLLILSLQRTESSFDLFLPCKIDSTKSLKENILKLKTSTAFLAITDQEELEFILPFADTMKNEALASKITDELEYVMVVPVEVNFGPSKPVFAKNEKDFFLDWPVEFYNRTLFESYNAKQQVLKYVRRLQVRK